MLQKYDIKLHAEIVFKDIEARSEEEAVNAAARIMRVFVPYKADVKKWWGYETAESKERREK